MVALRRFRDRARSVRREEAKGAVTAVEMEAAAKVVGQEVMEVRVAVRAVAAEPHELEAARADSQRERASEWTDGSSRVGRHTLL